MSGPASMSAALVRGKVARFTLLDSCGNPQISNSSHVTEGIVTVNSTKNVDNGDEIKVRQMNGKIGVYEPGQASMTSFTLAINLIRVDPGVLTMLTGDPAVLSSDSSTIVGFEEKQLQTMLQRFALEVWTDTSSNLCAGGSRVVGYMLYPMISQAYLTLDDVSDKEITATINGMGYGNPQWGRGPYGGTTPAGVTPGPSNSGTTAAPVQGRLNTAVDPLSLRHFELTPIAPPAPTGAPGPVSIILPTPY